MDLSRAMSDPVAAFEIARILQLKKNGAGTAFMKAWMSTFMGGIVEYEWFEPTDTRPEYFVAKIPSAMFIGFLGAMTTNIMVNIVSGYAEHRDVRGPTGFHRLNEVGYSDIYSTLRTTFGDIPPRIIIAGYSWGGTMALRLAVMLKFIVANSNVSVISFGSPKPGDDRNAQALNGIEICRWMNEGDAVPLAPPSPGRAPLLHTLVSRATSQAFQSFQQTGDGRILDAAGNITTGMFPPITTIYTDLSIGNFLVNNDAAVAVEHRIETYEARLSAWTVAHPEAPPPPPFNPRERRVQPQEFALGEPNPERMIAGFPEGEQVRNREGVFLLPRKLDDVVALLPPFNPGVALKPPYYYERVNGAHCLMHAGNMLDIFSTKRGAKSAVKSWNQCWGKWNRSVTGDSSALTDSVIENFLE